MVERVVVNKLVYGDEDGHRIEFNPGDVIDTDELGMSEEDVARLDEQRLFRARMDTAAPAPVTERRSGGTRNARDPRTLESEGAPRRRGRPRREDTDEL